MTTPLEELMMKYRTGTLSLVNTSKFIDLLIVERNKLTDDQRFSAETIKMLSLECSNLNDDLAKHPTDEENLRDAAFLTRVAAALDVPSAENKLIASKQVSIETALHAVIADAKQMRELRALAAEPLTVERLGIVWDTATHETGSTRDALVAVTRAIFAAQHTERAIMAAHRGRTALDGVDLRSVISCNQRAAVEGLGEVEPHPTTENAIDGFTIRQWRDRERVAVSAIKAVETRLATTEADRDREKARADKAEVEAAQYLKAFAEYPPLTEVSEDRADAAKWREAVAGVGDVERYARALWEAHNGRRGLRLVSESQLDQCCTEARAVLALFRARAQDYARQWSHRVAPEHVNAALDFACSDVEVATDPRPVCRRCGRRWVPLEGVDATRTDCAECRGFARLSATKEPLPPFVPVDVSALERDLSRMSSVDDRRPTLLTIIDLARRVNAAGLR